MKINPEELLFTTENAQQLDRLRAITRRLRAPDGCPWDREQTHESLIPQLIEETYEVVDAIRANDLPHLKEELGDLLLHIIFQADIAEDAEEFSLEDVARTISEKLIHRHPHVFDDSEVETTADVLAQWEQIKRSDRGQEDSPYLYGTGKGLPALLRAAKLQKKAAKVGFNWSDESEIFAKIEEELAEYKGAENAAQQEEELGDLLFAVVNLIRFRKSNPEELLARANHKFEQRFAALETLLESRNSSLEGASTEQMLAAWQEVKKSETIQAS